MLERPGEVDGAGLAFEEGQVVDRIERGVLFAPVPGVTGDDVGPAGDGHVIDPAQHSHLVMGIGRRHRVVIAVESHQRERVGMALSHPAGLERLGRESQHGGPVIFQSLGLGAHLAPDPSEQVGITGGSRYSLRAAHDGNDGTGTNRFRLE